MKITVFGTFHENVTDRSDVWKSALFRLNLVKKCTFSTFPLGLDRVWCTTVSRVLSVCPLVSSGVNFSQNDEKPLGLDRVFD